MMIRMKILRLNQAGINRVKQKATKNSKFLIYSSSSEEEEDFNEDSDEDSDFTSGRRKKNLRPVRRSTRARVSRFDTDFSKCLHFLRINAAIVNFITYKFITKFQ